MKIKKKLNIKTILLLIVLIIIGNYFLLISSFLNDEQKQLISSFLNDEQKQFIKKYIFPYQTISKQQQELSRYKAILSNQELIIKKNNSDILIKENEINLSNDITLKKYLLTSGFYSGIAQNFPGSGYIDFQDDEIVILSSRGILAFRKNLDGDKESFRQIQNNINEFIGIEQFRKSNWFSVKDLLIFNNKIFISYTEEIKNNCWNTSVIYADFNYKKIKFKKLFSPKECIHSLKNIDGEFNAHQSGGKIIFFDEKHILFSLGDYRSRYLAQDIKSVNGKIIKVNINNGDNRIISMGHRNPQGLFFDKEENIILETEHGPSGGDEVNLIKIKNINKDIIQNYGWPISSAGEHYGSIIELNNKIYEKYPLYKSHIKHGFIEPLKSFVPSIGISEITKIGLNKYVISSMKDKSLYFFELNKQKQMINLNRLEVFERVRDLKFKDGKLYLFMEDTASIGVLNLK